jgi:hypothetical protein
LCSFDSFVIAVHRSETPLFERLNAEDEIKRQELEQKQKEKEESELQEATFAPVIPKVSQELARKRSMSSFDREMSVYLRLNTTGTASGAASLCGTNAGDNMTVTDDSANKLLEDAAKCANTSPPTKVLAPKQYDEVIERLSMQKTRSFSFKTDPVELANAQTKYLKEPPKVSPDKLRNIVDRLQTPTASTIAPDIDALVRIQQQAITSTSTNTVEENLSPLARRLSESDLKSALLLSKKGISPIRSASFRGTPLERIEEKTDTNVQQPMQGERLNLEIPPPPSSSGQRKSPNSPSLNKIFELVPNKMSSPSKPGHKIIQVTKTQDGNISVSNNDAAISKNGKATQSRPQSAQRARTTKPSPQQNLQVENFERKLQESLALIQNGQQNVPPGNASSDVRPPQVPGEEIKNNGKKTLVNSTSKNVSTPNKTQGTHGNGKAVNSTAISPKPTKALKTPNTTTPNNTVTPTKRINNNVSNEKKPAKNTPQSKAAGTSSAGRATQQQPKQQRNNKRTEKLPPMSQEAEDFINSIPVVDVEGESDSIVSDW